MNLKKSALVLGIAAASAAPMFATADVSYSGVVRTTLTSVDTESTAKDTLDVGVTKARLKTKAVEELDSYKVIGEIEVDFDKASDDVDGLGGTGEIEVRTARLVWVGDFGAFVAGRMASGQFADHFGAIDIMEHNTDQMFDQPSRASYQFGWKTPNFGPVYAVIGGLAAGDSQIGGEAADDDTDVALARVVYKANGLKVSLGMAQVDLVSADADRDRTQFGISYASGPLSVAAGYEEVEYDDGSADRETTGFAISYKTGDVTLKAASEAYEHGTTEDDVVAFNVTYNASKNMYYYLETASYDVAAKDNTRIGAVLKF